MAFYKKKPQLTSEGTTDYSAESKPNRLQADELVLRALVILGAGYLFWALGSLLYLQLTL